MRNPPRAASQPAPRWADFLELGFRPLYIAGCAWAAISVALWVFAPQQITGALPGLLWHAHEMLWGFVATISVGFLCTAAASWTGVNPVRGVPLAGLVLLWMIARVALLLPGTPAFVFAVGAEALFFGGAAIALARSIYGTRNQRNYGVPLLVFALGVFGVLFLLAARRGDYLQLMEHFHAGLLCMAVIALLVARRVIPFFAMRAVAGLQVPMLTRSGQWQLAACLTAILCLLIDARLASAAALVLAGVLAWVQVIAWRPWSVRQVPLLWILYVGYAALGTGLLVAAAWLSGWVLRAGWPVHVIGVGGFAVLIIGMVTRTALGHLGRPLATDRSMVSAYLLVIAAAVLRLLALLPSTQASVLLQASAVAWVLAFLLYLWRFVPMLIRPRVR